MIGRMFALVIMIAGFYLIVIYALKASERSILFTWITRCICALIFGLILAFGFNLIEDILK